MGQRASSDNDIFNGIADPLVRKCDCCLEGIELYKCKGNGHGWIGNQVFRFRLAEEEKK